MKPPWSALLKATVYAGLAKLSLPLMIVPGLEVWGTEVCTHLHDLLVKELKRMEDYIESRD